MIAWNTNLGITRSSSASVMLGTWTVPYAQPVAVLKPTHSDTVTISVSAGTGGRVRVGETFGWTPHFSGSIEAERGAPVYAYAEALPGYMFAGWQGHAEAGALTWVDASVPASMHATFTPTVG